MMMIHVFAEARVKGLSVTIGAAEWDCIQRKRVSPFIVQSEEFEWTFSTGNELATFVRQYRVDGANRNQVNAVVLEAWDAIDGYRDDAAEDCEEAAPDTIRDVTPFAMAG